jgi:hypothetical protein
VTVALDPDRLPGDDARHLAVEVRDAVRALVVVGRTFVVDGEGEADFLRAALSPAEGKLSGVEVEVIDESRLAGSDLDRFDLVVLANAAPPPGEVAERLEARVRAGTGLVVFPGERVLAADLDRALWRDGEGVLPAPLEDPTGDSTRPRGVEVAMPDHPLVRGFAGPGNPIGALLRQVRVYRHAGIPRGLPETTRVVLSLDGPGTPPVLLERTVGRGRVLLFTTSADRSWTSWPRNPTYLVLLQEVLAFAGRAGEPGLRLEVGSPLRRSLDIEDTEGRVVIRSPRWPDEPESEHRAGADPDDPHRLLLDAGIVRHPGIHELRVARRDGETEVVRVAVNVHPAEGDLRRAEREEVESRLPGVEVVRGRATIARSTGEGRVELSYAVALALGGLLLLESLVAWRFGHHDRNGKGPESGGST